MVSAGAFSWGFSPLLILLLGGSLGLPIGVPPAAEDPFLAKVATEDCLYYASWAGTAPADPQSANETERLLAEPEVQRLVSEVENRLREGLRRLAAQEGDEKAVLAARTVPQLARTLLTRAGAVCLSKVEIQASGIAAEASAAFSLSGEAETTKRWLEELQESFAPGHFDRQEIAGAPFHQLRLPGLLLTWGVKDQYLIVGVGEGAVQRLLERSSKDPPRWLAELKQRLPVERRSTLTYVNLRKAVPLVVGAIGEPKLRTAIDALGLGNLSALAATGGFEGSGFATKTWLGVAGPRQALLAMVKEEGLKPTDLKTIPADATVALAFRLDAREALENLIEIVARIEPKEAAGIQKGLDEFQQNLGVDLRNDVLASLGDVWHLSTSPSEGGLALGWVAAVSVRDHQRLTATLNRMIGFAQASFPRGRRSPQIRTFQHAGRDIYFLDVPDHDFPVAPSWCLTQEQLLVALFPQAIKSRLSRTAGEKSLADRPEIAPWFRGDGGPALVLYQDTRAVFELLYPFLQIGARAALVQARELDLDVSLLPSTGCIARHLQPGVFVLRSTPQGIETFTTGTLPGGSPGATGPLAAALLLPAVQESRAAARRSQSMCNMKQIGVALHSYHDTYKAFPAAFSTDKEGKPLLSWRVHLLPFLEHAALYNQFHLDEPWDSEHNRPLIAQMPAVYRSPNSSAEPGKTVYLAVRHEDGVLAAPADSQRGRKAGVQGTRLDQIRDGLSRTILLVEASDASAEVWTKPDDLAADKDDPFKGILGLHPRGFHAVFADGSVRFLPANMDRATLKALITKGGAEIVDLPWTSPPD